MNPLTFKEDHISQIPALQLLQKLGYTYLSPEDALNLRGGKTTGVILESILRKQLKEINSIRLSSSKTSFFSDGNIELGIQALKELPLHEGYTTASEYAYTMLTLGKALEQSIDGDKKSFTLQYIDWKNPENNVFHVTEEYIVMRSGSKDHYVPDIVLFVNGIPLSIIECKRPDGKEPLSEAISQHLRNQNEEGIRSLYAYSQILLSIATLQAKYATTDTQEKHWSKWHEMYFLAEEEKADRAKLYQLVNTPLDAGKSEAMFKHRLSYEKAFFVQRESEQKSVSEQDEYLYQLCRPERLLDITKNFILFDANQKKICRYQQYFAVKNITQRIQSVEGGKRKGGVIWHTQGSGKSLTMAMLAKAIAQHIQNPKIVLVTDRVQLDKQISDTFRDVEIPVRRASTGNQLTEYLQSKSDAVITTVINKFEAAVNQLKEPLESPNIFVLVDEGHRTQYGTFNVKMQKSLPNACFLAFTGTPLMHKEKNTANKFGGIIQPTYTIIQAVADGAVVPIIYEGRHALQEVNQKPIDTYFDMVSEPLTEYQKADLKKKFSRADQINKTDQRIHAIAWDIVNHYTANWGVDKTGERSGFKGMVVCPDKLTAVRYKEVFDQIGRVSTEVIISPPDEREGYEDAYGEPADKVLAFWKKQESRLGKNYETSLLNKFKNSDEPELIIVVDKLLTGFDEPRVVVMYVCKMLREHTLFQAISRVNRVAEGKDFGYIIDYEGILGELDETMNIYSGLNEFDLEDLKGSFANIETEIAKLPQHHSDLCGIFKGIYINLDLVAYADYLADEAIRVEFYQKLAAYAKCLKMALSSLEFERNTPEKLKQRYKDDLKFFVQLRNSVVNTYSDRIDFKQYEKGLQKLLDQYVSTNEIIRLTNQVDIIDREAFEKEVEKVLGVAAKAETIASRTTKYINEKMEEDPAFYKKLSELIQQTIADYRAKRISELDFLNKAKEYSDQAISRKGDDIPAELQNKDVAQAYFRQLKDDLSVKIEDDVLKNDACLSTAISIDNIITKYILDGGEPIIDWQNKSNITGKLLIEIGDYLIDELRDKYNLVLTFQEMDVIAEKCLEIAKIRYKA